MGRFFSDVVDQVIEDIYYCYDNDRAKQAQAALLKAASQGDGDACYLLSRCFSGTCFSWYYHPFEENEASAFAMLRRGISLGSALAVLGALRMDMLTPELREMMPFSSVKEAWEVIDEKAKEGCLLCQYLIGNTYYFLDVIEIEDKKEGEFENSKAWDEWCKEQMEKCVPLFENAFAGGLSLAGRNLRDYYKQGRGNLIPPQPPKALEVIRRGAQLGYPDWMYHFGYFLFYKEKKKEEGLFWGLEAAKKGHVSGWGLVGDAYYFGEGVKQDFSYALECFEKAADDGNDDYACGMVGDMYFLGQGTSKDYARAVQYLERCYAMRDGKDMSIDKLGLCCLLGYGCQQDVARGRQLLENGENTKYKNYGLGMMYAEGMGVPEDIKKGVEYLKAAGDYEPAKEALKRYKKSLFGVWRRL